ncbi:MAG TPA: Gfo/Idh/MocA family oxidoreductase [Anaeromyxobacter sp.]
MIAIPSARSARPRLGFLGVGWIGRHRLRALVHAGAAEAAAIADAVPAAAAVAAADAPGCVVVPSLDALLALGLDGIVIATPSALHADQAVRALERGVAVFCQKPLARTAAEARRVVDAARAADRLLGVDLSYRHVAGVPELRRLVREGALGRVYAADLVFHNAYGPDKAWFQDARLSGGGCVMDLGIHLVDLALWVLGFPEVNELSAALRAGGVPIRGRGRVLAGASAGGGGRASPGASGGLGGDAGPPALVEDYAAAQLELADGTSVRLACSWRLAAGQDCLIEASFYGTAGGGSLRNVGGSFYDFVVERFQGTRRERIAGPPDAWGGRAAVAWAEALARGGRFDPEIASIVEVQATLDRIYEL